MSEACTCPPLWTGQRKDHWPACPGAKDASDVVTPPVPAWGPSHPNFLPGYDDMTTDEWFAYISGGQE